MKPKPKWPYPDITPMHAHVPTGQWRRRWRGRDYYFGPIAKPKVALARWRAEWPIIASGQTLVSDDAAVGLGAACEAFMAATLAKMDRGDIVPDTLATYRQRCQLILNVIGSDTPIRLINEYHFDALLETMDRMHPSTRADRVIKIKTIMQWIGKRYGVAIRIPDSFRGPPMKVRRLAGGRAELWTPDEIHRIIAIAPPLLRAVILLGINGGYKPNDLAWTRTAELDIRHAIITQRRRKTGAPRRVPLWPETLAALRPLIVRTREHMLVWPNGLQLVRPGCRDLSRSLKPLRDAAGIAKEFQWLRHTFSTIAHQARDDDARDIIMGHLRASVPDTYVLDFEVKRLLVVTDHVRRWLYA